MLKRWRTLWKLRSRTYRIRSCLSSHTSSCRKASGTIHQLLTLMLTTLPKIVRLVGSTLKKIVSFFFRHGILTITPLSGITMKNSFRNALTQQVHCTRHLMARKGTLWHSCLSASGIANVLDTSSQKLSFRTCFLKSFTCSIWLSLMQSITRTRTYTQWPKPSWAVIHQSKSNSRPHLSSKKFPESARHSQSQMKPESKWPKLK